ncbi:hypothetical protein FRB97_003998 [Tulasnella sp. 331]|nr:hypothetical protein FRB97_003998 [Tulasnella sp. 331]
MGGNAFAHLNCPRLPHNLYHTLRTQCQSALEGLYTKVKSPPVGPSKRDHGDIDFLVAGPKHSPSAETILKALGATTYLHTSGSSTTHFAIPLPDGNHAQVDLHVCPDNSFHWELFMQSYGDLLQILGVLNRPLGLTADNRGLYIRIPEIEPSNKKKAMVSLTADANVAMRFLGLDVLKYSNGFSTNEQVFEWCMAGRFYGPVVASKVNNETHNDRVRYRKREMFTACMKEWLPAHPEVWSGRKLWTREEVLAEALEYFPDARHIYHQAMSEYNQELWEVSVLKAVREAVPLTVEYKAGDVMRGLKRFVTLDPDAGWTLHPNATQENIVRRPVWMTHITTETDKARLCEWVSQHWSEVREQEKERAEAKKAERMLV